MDKVEKQGRHTQRKNKIVTNPSGYKLCLRVKVAALVVLLLSTRNPERVWKNLLTTILVVQVQVLVPLWA